MSRRSSILLLTMLVVGVVSAELTVSIKKVELPEDERAGFYRRQVVYSPMNNTVYASCEVSDWMFAIDPGTDSVVARISVGPGVRTILPNPVNGKVYMSRPVEPAALEEPDSAKPVVVVVDGATHKVLKPIPVGPKPEALCLDPLRNKVYCGWLRGIQVIDASLDSVVATVETARALHHCWYIPGGNKLYCSRDGTLTAFDCSTLSETGRVGLSPHPNSVLVAPNVSRAYVCVGLGSSSCAVVDTDEDSYIGWLDASDGSPGLCYDSTAKVLYFWSAETLFLFDCTADTIIGRIYAEGGYPSLVSCDPIGGLVCLAGGYGLKVLDIETEETSGFVRTLSMSICCIPGKGKFYSISRDNVVTVVTLDR